MADSVRERPILFSAPMVRALMAGTKTQTRRAIKPQPYVDAQGNFCWNGSNFGQDFSGPHIQAIASPLPTSKTGRVRCPYGKRGDRLWVRETWMDLQGTGVEHRSQADGKLQRYAYGADTPPGSYGDECRKDFGLKWRPSIHMPRWASRITLEVTGVRVERLQDISEADAAAEGIEPIEGSREMPGPNHFSVREVGGWANFPTAQEAYRYLWESINGPASWDANPWVWVVEFRRVEAKLLEAA